MQDTDPFTFQDTDPFAFMEKAPSTPTPLAIWSVILGFLGCTILNIMGSVPAVIFGHMALSRIKRDGGVVAAKRLAIVGLILGYLGLAISLVLITGYLLLILNYLPVDFLKR